VIGAGPTGVEMAGRIAELARDTLRSDFRSADPGSGRILLIEAADRVLTAFPPWLRRAACCCAAAPDHVAQLDVCEPPPLVPPQAATGAGQAKQTATSGARRRGPSCRWVMRTASLLLARVLREGAQRKGKSVKRRAPDDEPGDGRRSAAPIR